MVIQELEHANSVQLPLQIVYNALLPHFVLNAILLVDIFYGKEPVLPPVQLTFQLLLVKSAKHAKLAV